MRLPHLRVWMLMGAVGLVAALFWGALMGSRSYDYARRARAFAAEERAWRREAARGALDPKVASEAAEYFARLTQKYRRATWSPWSPVDPDPHAPGYDQWVEQESRAKAAGADPAATEAPPPRKN